MGVISVPVEHNGYLRNNSVRKKKSLALKNERIKGAGIQKNGPAFIEREEGGTPLSDGFFL
ncbi:MAG: hypothetical protein JW774_13185 [Candidatus Aureabacteria bacterium]|nr:hypothetical protein [Candidatus Auribacterota bacterium]